MKKIEKTIEFGGKTLKLSTGNLAQQATGSVLAQYGETVVLATVVAQPMRTDLGYFPLFVEYRERLYAGGIIKGSRWVKREGRPTDDEILTARLIDRAIRPLFPKEYKKEVQVMITVLSVDLENSPDVISLVAASAALSVSNIPWNGPIGTVRIGRVGSKFVINPTISEIEKSDVDLVASSMDKVVVMIESGAKEISEKDMLDVLTCACKENKKLTVFINDFAESLSVKKEAIEKETENKILVKSVKEKVGKSLTGVISKLATKEMSYSDLDEFKALIKDSFEDAEKDKVGLIIEKLIGEEIRKMVLSGKRPDGRKSDELRELSASVKVLPRVHGSAIFERGQTQVMSIATLGAPSLKQTIETAEGEETKRYMHHYSMPPYSVGETGRVGSPSRREIGHGALAERAIMPVLPSDEKFPYAVRIVSEVLGSNGSTSMASTCGSSLALMDAGVPIKCPVTGIAMGLIIESEKEFVVLTDITGLEDGKGDMDFKVAGTADGITALQMDVKAASLTLPILEKALEQAKTARMKIMDVITSAIAKPREKVSTNAPKIKAIKIPTEKIGEIIGPGGKIIKSLMAETGAQIDVEDDGTVNVSGLESDGVEKAIEKIDQMTRDVLANEVYEGEVKRIEDFGAFVEILPGRDGLVHVSEMGEEFVRNPRDVVSIGKNVTVRVKEVDEMGRINLSMILDPARAEELKKERTSQKPKGGFERKPSRNFSGSRRDRRPRRDNGGGQRSTGPHFPASRYVDTEKDFKKNR